MEARNRTLPDWVTRVRTRQVVLPRFQRMEAWGHREITDLLEAVINGLPVGSVLIMEVGDNIPFVYRTMAGAPEDGERITEMLLDGQQRLTAIWRTITEDYSDRTYYIEFPKNDDDGFHIMSQSRWNKKGKRYPVWADDPKLCWDRRLVPVRLLRPGDEAEVEMDKWVERAVDLGSEDGEPSREEIDQERKLSREIIKLRQKVAQFNLPFLSLSVSTPKDVALNVFIKMNTRTVRLTTFDIIVAQTEEATGESLHDLVEGLASTVPNLSDYDTPEDIVMSVMALLQNRVPNQSGYLGIDLPQMIDDWGKMVEASKRAIEFFEQEMVFDSTRLPTESILAPIIALWSFVDKSPDAQGNARVMLRKYMWRGFFTDRYERAAATAALQDYRALRDVIKEGKSESIVPCFNELDHPLPEVEALVQARWPRKRDRLARAILQVSLRGGANDIADDNRVSRSQLKQREYHHLFPVGYLRDLGSHDENANRALNCALISWRTNRAISAKEPLQYLKERADASTLGEVEIRRRLATHSINYDSMAKGDYDKFLKERAKLIFRAMRDLCDGMPWSPE